MVAKLYFYYSAMNAGKSTTLLQSSYNYNERGMQTMLFLPKLIGTGKVISRIGLQKTAVEFGPEFDFFEHVQAHRLLPVEPDAAGQAEPLSCVLVDECQFLCKSQVQQLAKVCDQLGIPVLCYGLRTDFLGEPFEGSKYLLGMADVISEIKTICHCGRKATMNQRVTASGEAVAEGEQVEVGGNERYIGRCRKHWTEHLEAAAARKRASTNAEYETPKKARTLQKRPTSEEVAASGATDDAKAVASVA